MIPICLTKFRQIAHFFVTKFGHPLPVAQDGSDIDP